MKNFKHCLLALVCLLLPVSAFAQLEELQNKSIAIAETSSEELIPDTQWYLVRNSYYNAYFMDRGEGSEVYLSNGTGVVYDGMSASNAAQYLVRFISVEPSASDTHDRYYLQFGSGNYIWWPSSVMSSAISHATMEEANTAYVYCIVDTPGHFAINESVNLCVIDSWGAGSAVITWAQGFLEEEWCLGYLDGSEDWRLIPVTLEGMSDFDAAVSNLEYTYLAYIGYYDSFPAGTQYGCYTPEAVEAFQGALDAAAALIDSDELASTPVEEIEQATQNILDTYEAVLNAYISRTIDVAEGYYFFNSGLAFYEYDNEGNTVYPTKGMYSEEESGGIYAKWMTTDNTCPFLWKVTAKGDKTYEVVNMATDATFDAVSTSTKVGMTVGGENLMKFDAGNDDADGCVYIRVSTQQEDGYYYLHCNNHNDGKGSADYIVGWCISEPSMWKLVAVSDEEAQAIIDDYAAIKDSKQRYTDTKNILKEARAMMDLAENVTIGTTGLITDVSQLSSPYNEPTEGSLAALIDGSIFTFWHSVWSDGVSYPMGVHYLQVELNEPVDEFVFTFSRRYDATYDHLTEWGVYGAPDFDSEKSECTFLSEIYTPLSSAFETLTSNIIETKGFSTLRFYFDATEGFDNGNNENRGYAHMSEFQLYEAVCGATSQKVVMGEIYTNLENAMEQAVMEGEDITVETYTALKAAYEAFLDVVVDATELRETLEDAQAAVKGMVIGTNPGQWSDTSVGSSFSNTVDEATAYYDACVYTEEQNDAYIATLKEGKEDFMEAANKVQTDKWYKIRFATLEEMETNGWNNTDCVETIYDEALYGKYIVVANYTEENWVTYKHHLTEADLDNIFPGQYILFDDEEDIEYDDYTKFRFVNVGDTAYLIQNKATGLFMKSGGTNRYVTLDVHPSLYTVSAIGCGESLISSWTVDGSSENNLNAQRDYNVLVTWPDAYPGSSSGFYIEDIDEAVADNYDGTGFNTLIRNGEINTFCYPVPITAYEGTAYTVSVDGTTVTLIPLEGNAAEAGQPFLYINGNTDDYNADDEAELVVLNHGYEVASEAQTTGQLVGSYSSMTVRSGNVIVSGNGFKVVATSASLSAHGAYIPGEYSSDDVITFEISDETYDSIEQAVAAVAQEGNIYSIDGKLLGKGNLNTVKALGKGIYIVNGVKVAVK